MARNAIQGTFSAGGGHSASHISDPGTTGDVVLAWDNAKVTTQSALKKVLQQMLLTLEGSDKLAR